VSESIANRGSRWHRIALPASIILNLFLIAIISGHVLHNRGRGVIAGTALGRVLGRAEVVLPPKDAAAFGAVIRRDTPKFASSAQRMRAAREELETQIAAEPFNPAATRQALVATKVAWNQFLDDFSASLIEALAQVSPEGRRKLVSESQLGPTLPPDKKSP
jgi:uncharacterized membrane protein